MACNPLTVRGVTMNIQAIHPKQALQDATDAAQLEAFAHQLATGEEETVPAAVAHALLEGANPVKVWREHRALTQDALAAQAGISKAFLCQIETGKRVGAIKTLRALAAALGVTVDDLQSADAG